MFCPKCSSLLVPKKGHSKVAFYCSKCDKRYYPKDNLKVKEKRGKKKDKVIFMQSGKNDVLPKTTSDCPKCKNNKAYYWIVQTRASDEPPTKFLKCVKCEHRWRDYG